MEDEIPMRRTVVLTARRSLALEEELNSRLESLRQRGVDVNEWIRQVIRRELSQLEEKVG